MFSFVISSIIEESKLMLSVDVIPSSSKEVTILLNSPSTNTLFSLETSPSKYVTASLGKPSNASSILLATVAVKMCDSNR